MAKTLSRCLHQVTSGSDARGGAAYAFSKKWSGQIEYLHTDFGTVTGTSVFPLPNGPNFTHTHNVSLTTDVVRAGAKEDIVWGKLAVKFNPFAP